MNVYLFLPLFFIIIGILSYSFFIEPNCLVIHKNQIKVTESGKTLRIVQLSDIHLKKNYSVKALKQIVEKTNTLQPDIVVFTGDLFDDYARFGIEIQDEVSQLFRKINAPYGKFAIYGNHEYSGLDTNFYETILEAADFTVLKNTGKLLPVSHRISLYVAGLEDSLYGQTDLAAALVNRPAGTPTLLLTHEPDVADSAVNKNIDLILAGHSHGGQIRLPFFTYKNQLAKKYTHGLYHLEDETPLIVHPGIGTTKISARFGVLPTIELIELTI
ncbi:metallophosphoesterase [Enterococcus faecalis]|nr:metallophosphoesterase [Enterococcus faecalis]